MKQIYLFRTTLLSLLLALTTGVAHAQTIHRITSGMNLQTEIDNAASGDIYIVEAGIQRTDLNLEKRVTLIGTGYFLNSSNTANRGVASVGTINLKPGAEGSMITGLQTYSININASNVIVQRCYLEGEGNRLRIGYNTTGHWNGVANNVMLLQNYAPRLEWIARSENGVTNSSANNCTVKGNIFYRYGFHLEGNISGEISNNSFMPGVTSGEDYHSFQSSINARYEFQWVCKILPIIFRNNIMPKILVKDCSINAYPTTDFNGNVFTQDFQNLLPGNTINADPDALFLGYPNNPNNSLAPDARAQLAASSPARGAGVGGVDAGAFGGDTPYILNGIPSIPTIYQLSVPTEVPQGGTLNVQIKAKTNN